jgi:hypothetical protein
MEGNKEGCCSVKPDDGACATGKTGDCGSKKCCGTILKGALLGAIVMFAVFAASWMLLPFHKADTLSFANEKIIASLMANNAPQSGIYVLQPGMTAGGEAAPAQPTPFVFAAVSGNASAANNLKTMLKGFLFYFFGAALLTKLLKKCGPGGGCPVFCAMKIGVLVALFSYVPNMIWFHFPLRYSLLGMADILVAFTLAGAAISCCVLKSGPCTMGKCSTEKCDDKGDKKTGCCM